MNAMVYFSRNYLRLLLVIFSLSLFSCNDDDDDEVMNLIILPQKGIDHHPLAGDREAYIARDETGAEFTIVNIDGFEEHYEEGYEYVIRVKVIRIKKYPPNWDEFENEYVLIKIISKKRAEV